MKLETAQALTIELMGKWKLNHYGYSFKWTNTKRILGYCCYSKRTISLSASYVKLNGKAEVRDTILHEIAHALAHEKDGATGHCKVWKKWCRTVGAQPKRCSSKAKIDYRYTIYCKECKRLVANRHRYRNQNEYYCGKDGCKGSLYHIDNQTGKKVKTDNWGERIK